MQLNVLISTQDCHIYCIMYTLVHNLAFNIASYCTSGRSIFTSRTYHWNVSIL